MMSPKNKRAELVANMAATIASGIFAIDKYAKEGHIVDAAERILDEVESRLGEPIYGWSPGDKDTEPDVPDYWEHLERDPDPNDPNDDLPF